VVYASAPPWDRFQGDEKEDLRKARKAIKSKKERHTLGSQKEVQQQHHRQALHHP
jgi:hypothetical protein